MEMDRVNFIPGPEAKSQIYDAEGHIFFGRETAIDFADEFVAKLMGDLGNGNGHLPILFQTMGACLSVGDRVDIWFGLADNKPEAGLEAVPSGELVGHSWAVFRSADGQERILWEVGRDSPAAGNGQATRAFNNYRWMMATSRGEEIPEPLPVDQRDADVPTEFKGKPVMSRALAPGNLYNASGRMWYFVDLAAPGDVAEPALISRPMRSFDALILATLMTLINGKPPVVFGIRPTIEGLGKMPLGFVRALYEEDQRVEPTDEKPLLVM